jgi:hypothetical protein
MGKCRKGGSELKKKNPHEKWYWGKTKSGEHVMFSSIITPSKRTHPEYVKVCGSYPTVEAVLRDKKHAITHMTITCESNPPPKGKRVHKRTVIYDNLLAIEATKGSSSNNFSGEHFRHDFKRRGTKVIGEPDGSLRIIGKKPLWNMFNY